MSTLTLRPARREEIPAVVALNLAAFGPSAERRAIDYPAWRLLNATAEFDDSGRHTIVVTDRAEDGTEKIVATAEWIAPGGADPVTPLEERKAKWREIQKEWPTSLDRAATIEFGNAVGPSMAAALEAAGLPEGADNNMWGASRFVFFAVGRLLTIHRPQLHRGG
ncbi:hypothetical protein GQ53DRAFT_762002 [Thozetella sp. PMI_491]|nr:hypothetical protein GQ53DRAFT_762002 [Thozetella sp. PMI_491]